MPPASIVRSLAIALALTLYGSETKHSGIPPQSVVPQWSSMRGPNQASSVRDCPSRLLPSSLVACFLRMLLSHLGTPGAIGEILNTSCTTLHPG